MQFFKNIKNNRNTIHGNHGFTIVEVIVATAIISVTVFALMITAQKGVELSTRALKQSQANILLEEGAEAVKSIRDNNWTTISDLSLDTDYYLYFDNTNNIWTLNTSSTTPNGFTPVYPIDSTFVRKVIASSVYRDAEDDIASSGTIDTNTKKIAVSVSWVDSKGSISKDLVFYIADIFN